MKVAIDRGPGPLSIAVLKKKNLKQEVGFFNSTCEPIQYSGNYDGNDGEDVGDIFKMSATSSATFFDKIQACIFDDVCIQI